MSFLTFWKWAIAVAIATFFVQSMNIDYHQPAYLFGFGYSFCLMTLIYFWSRRLNALAKAGQSRWSWSSLQWLLGIFVLGIAQSVASSHLHIDPLGPVALQGFWTAFVFCTVVCLPFKKAEKETKAE